MDQAVKAAARALETAFAGPRESMEYQARLAITAAYPHLFQNLARENRELRAEVDRLNELLSPKR